MTDSRDHLPRRYFVDENGRRVLIGLSIEETFEFETLDNRPALPWDENGAHRTTRERRWLELYGKHDQAWKQWMVETAADRSGNLSFIN